MHYYFPTANCDDGDVRLLLGSNERKGYVLVCINNRWGPMCHHYRDNTEATMNNVKTVCSQLGYTGGRYMPLCNEVPKQRCRY